MMFPLKIVHAVHHRRRNIKSPVHLLCCWAGAGVAIAYFSFSVLRWFLPGLLLQTHSFQPALWEGAAPLADQHSRFIVLLMARPAEPMMAAPQNVTPHHPPAAAAAAAELSAANADVGAGCTALCALPVCVVDRDCLA